MPAPWAERHRPRRLADVHGNPQAVADLRKWAEAWKAGKPRDRGVILAGPPGCGKTSAAHALGAEMGWEIIELNASDARNAAALERVAGVGARNETFSSTGEYHASRAGRRKLIILDEADNLYERGSEGESVGDLGDRGGKRAIADILSQTGQPIILIVNDAYQLSRGSGDRVSKLCLKIAFRRVSAASIKKVLGAVATLEGLEVAPPVLDTLASRAEGDLRSALNDLEALSMGKTRVDSLGDVPLGERNRGTTAFDAVSAVFRASDGRVAVQAVRDLDETPDFMLAWLDENLPFEYRDPRDLARAYDRLSRADVLLGRAQRRQQFALWGYATEVMAMGVNAAKERTYSTPPNYRFPGWIRSMGASKGERGLRDRVAERMGALTHMGKRAFRRDVWADLQRIAAKDLEFATALGVRSEMDEEEIRHFLGPQTPASYADQVVANVERVRAGTPESHQEPVPVDPSPAKPSRGRSASLGDF